MAAPINEAAAGGPKRHIAIISEYMARLGSSLQYWCVEGVPTKQNLTELCAPD
jgi:hypothetical protein